MTDILDPDYESHLTEEEQNRLALMCGHAVAPPLSPATQAVLNALNNNWEADPYEMDLGAIATALRAAAVYCKRDKLILLSLANELDP